MGPERLILWLENRGFEPHDIDITSWKRRSWILGSITWLMIHLVTPPNWNSLKNTEACVSLLVMNISMYWKSECSGSRDRTQKIWVSYSPRFCPMCIFSWSFLICILYITIIIISTVLSWILSFYPIFKCEVFVKPPEFVASPVSEIFLVTVSKSWGVCANFRYLGLELCCSIAEAFLSLYWREG